MAALRSIPAAPAGAGARWFLRDSVCSRPLIRLAALAAGLAGSTLAYALSPVVSAVAPAGGQRGTQVEVTFRGERLADAQEVFLYRPGITVAKIVEATPTQFKVLLTLAPDCPLGEHALRIRTASGISALRLFYVGPFPAVEEKEPNNSPAKPQPVGLNTTVHGTIGNEDVDLFVIEARKDQRLSLEVEGARLGRTMFDPHLSLTGPDGKVLAESDDSPLLGHDGFLSVIAPTDGKYVVQLRDMAYAGAGHFYRLHVGTFPRPTTIFPLGGQPGETLAAKFTGDPAGAFEQSIPLPALPVGRFGAEAVHDGAAPSPNWVRVVNLPTIAHIAAGSGPSQAPILDQPAPFAFDGILASKNAPAFIRFNAKKDQHLEFQVYARRLGSPVDSVLTVMNAKGGNLASNDDASGYPDSMVRLRIPEDGTYTIKINDQLNRGGPAFTYRVEVTPVQPALTLSIPDTARYDNETRKSIVVPRGNRFAVLMNINRDTCNDALTLAFDGLPAGITASADTIPGSVSAVPVVFEAAADAPIAGTLLTPAARALAPKNADAAPAAAPFDLKGLPPVAPPSPQVVSRFRHAVEWVRIQNDTVYVRSEVDRIAAAVVEEAPFTIRIVEPKVPLVQNGEMNLQLAVDRREGFDEPITVKMLWNPPGVSSLPDVTIPKGSSSATYKLNATAKADVRTWKIAVIASAAIEKATVYVSSQLADLEVGAVFLQGRIDLAKVERGQTTKLICNLDHKVPFEGTAIARLVGLPANVTAKEVEITKDSKQAVFEVVATDKSSPGMTKNLSCNVVITRNGEPISQTIAPGSMLRVDPPRAKPVAAPSTATPAATVSALPAGKKSE